MKNLVANPQYVSYRIGDDWYAGQVKTRHPAGFDGRPAQWGVTVVVHCAGGDHIARARDTQAITKAQYKNWLGQGWITKSTPR